METGVFADRDGVVREVLVGAGTQVDTKQLLLVVVAEDEVDEADGDAAADGGASGER